MSTKCSRVGVKLTGHISIDTVTFVFNFFGIFIFELSDL